MKDLNKLVKKYDYIFKNIAESLYCPSCKRLVRSPFFNLGPPFFQGEGCKDCYEKVLNKNRK